MQRIVLVTGLSGSGLRTAINILDDLGFYCMDNIPVDLVETTVNGLKGRMIQGSSGIVIGIRIKSDIEKEAFLSLKASLRISYNIDHLFFEAEAQALVARYSANRRRHLLFKNGSSLSELMELEKNMLAPLRGGADCCVETSKFTPSTLSRFLSDRYEGASFSRRLYVSIVSFGFKHGQPTDLETLFDVRFLKNPYFDDKLRDKTGLHPQVYEYLSGERDFHETLTRLVDWHKWSLPRYYDEGKHYFRLGIGCTGGIHRSVCVAENLLKRLESEKLKHISYSLSHRDLGESS